MTRRRDDEGFTLIEMVIAGALGVVVLILVATFFISSFSAQTTVTNTADAASRAQLLVRQLEHQLRGASAVTVVDGLTSESQLLIARTATGEHDVDYHCEAWFYDSVAEAVFHTTYQNKTTWPWGTSITSWIDLGSGLTEAIDLGEVLGDTLDWLFGGASGASSAEWTLLATGVRPAGASDGGPAIGIFGVDGPRSATYDFEVTAGGGNPPVLISTTTTGRQPFDDKEPACF